MPGLHRSRRHTRSLSARHQSAVGGMGVGLRPSQCSPERVANQNASMSPEVPKQPFFNPVLVDEIADMIWEAQRRGEMEPQLAIRILERAAREWRAHGIPQINQAVD